MSDYACGYWKQTLQILDALIEREQLRATKG
jgi:hypothetical protein